MVSAGEGAQRPGRTHAAAPPAPSPGRTAHRARRFTRHAPGSRVSAACSPAPSASDAHHLVARVRTGDRAAFEALFRRHHRRLWRFAHQQVACADAARELVRDVFFVLRRRRRVGGDVRRARPGGAWPRGPRPATPRHWRWNTLPQSTRFAISAIRGASSFIALPRTDFSVYQKSGLGGRAELAAFFLQDLVPPAPDAHSPTASPGGGAAR